MFDTHHCVLAKRTNTELPRDSLALEVEETARVLRLQRAHDIKDAADADRDGVLGFCAAHVCVREGI